MARQHCLLLFSRFSMGVYKNEKTKNKVYPKTIWLTAFNRPPQFKEQICETHTVHFAGLLDSCLKNAKQEYPTHLASEDVMI